MTEDGIKIEGRCNAIEHIASNVNCDEAGEGFIIQQPIHDNASPVSDH